MTDEAYIYEAIRTPRGRGKRGSLYATKPVDLIVGLIDELRSRLPGLDPEYIDDLVLGVTLIADGRRQQAVGQDIGPNPPGEGAEIILHEVPVLSTLGLTMTGPRPGGFGALDAKTNEICGPGDLICAAPPEAFSLANLPRTLDILAGGAGQPVHALYATTQFWSLDGQPSTEWTLNWAHNAIQNAPQRRK